MTNSLRILEIGYSVSPGGTDWYEVYDVEDDFTPPIFESEHLDEAVKFCYDSGYNFEVHTLAAWEREYGN
jgi:hypothetical protein